MHNVQNQVWYLKIEHAYSEPVLKAIKIITLILYRESVVVWWWKHVHRIHGANGAKIAINIHKKCLSQANTISLVFCIPYNL